VVREKGKESKKLEKKVGIGNATFLRELEVQLSFLKALP
jgi:hypothetical protein